LKLTLSRQVTGSHHGPEESDGVFKLCQLTAMANEVQHHGQTVRAVGSKRLDWPTTRSQLGLNKVSVTFTGFHRTRHASASVRAPWPGAYGLPGGHDWPLGM
jgi:hypothetical protein